MTLSNRYYDPVVGHRLYSEYLDQAVLAEKLGYDGTCVNEHHQNAYGTMPDPNVMASHIVARTRDIRVGVIGNALPLHGNPLRVAESVAMLDVISKGRIISGFVRGTGMEYHSMRSNPATSRERFWEAHDLIVKAWTEDGPFDWQGRFRHPLRQSLAAALSKAAPADLAARAGLVETIREAAKRRYPFMMVFAPLAFTKVNYDMYRRAAEEFGYEPAPEQLAFCVATYVAETDEKAHQEAKEHLMWLFHTGSEGARRVFHAAGLHQREVAARHVDGQSKYNIKPFWELTYEDLIDEQYVIVGSPATVAEKLAIYTDELGAGIHVAGGMQVGTMPHWKVVKNMTLFAEEVMPHFRPPGNEPAWKRGVPIPGAAEPR